MSILSIQNLSKTYRSGDDTLLILDRIDFSAEPGESIIITGESGSGKSTLLNIIGGLDAPDEGEVSVCGQRLDGAGEGVLSRFRNEKTGFIFQFHYLLKDFTAWENVMMPGRISGGSGRNLKEEGAALLEKVGLGARVNHYPGQLSGGERQRVALARALMNRPPLILADEPTGSLDEKNSRVVEDLLFRLIEETGTTLIMVTHDPQLASRGSVRYHLHGGSLAKR